MIRKALLAFVITFCAPALLINCYKTYSAAGSSIGKFVYEATSGVTGHE